MKADMLELIYHRQMHETRYINIHLFVASLQRVIIYLATCKTDFSFKLNQSKNNVSPAPKQKAQMKPKGQIWWCPMSKFQGWIDF